MQQQLIRTIPIHTFTVPTEAVYDAKSKLRTLSSNLGGKIGFFNGKTEKTFNYPSSAKYLVLENTGTGNICNIWNAF